jgi:hypothetical protein
MPVTLEPEVESMLKELPRNTTGVWMGDRRMSRARLKKGPLAVAVWVDAKTGAVRSLRPEPAERNSAQALMDSLVQAMSAGERPLRVAVPAKYAPHLQPVLDRLEVIVDMLESPQLLDVAFRDLEAYLNGPRRSYLKQDGITPGHVRRLFRAASDFYDLAPWRDFTDTMLFEFRGLSQSPVFCSVMGADNIETGLSIFLKRAGVEAIAAGDHETARNTACIGMTFAELDNYPKLLLREAAAHEWPLSGPGGQLAPMVIRTDRPLAPFPTPGEIKLIVDVVDTFAGLYHDARFPDTVPPRAFLLDRREVMVRFGNLSDLG